MARTPCRTAPDPLDPRDERIVSLLRDLVRVNTEHADPAPGAPYGEGCARALALVLDECARRGFKTHRVDDSVAWAEVGSSGPLAAFPVHLDVVPAGEGWSRDPYAAEVEDGVLYGRGCMDNKIGAALLVNLVDELACEARAAGRELPCRMRVIFGTDEETGMSDLRRYVESGEDLPELGFVPDAGFPAVRGEKARLHLAVSAAARTGELRVTGGSLVNVVPAEARAHVPAEAAVPALRCTPPGVEAALADDGGVDLAAHGRAAHGSTPERGENAAAALVCHLCESGAKIPYELRLIDRLLCRDLTGGALGADVADPTFGHTSVNMGLLSVGDGAVRAELDVRFGTGLSVEEVVGRVREAFGPGWSVDVVQEKPVHLVPANDPCLKALLAAYEEVTGDPAEAEVMGGGTYASFLPALCAFGPKLPGTHSGAHGADEHVSLENISRAAAIYRAALRNLAELASARASRED